MNSYQLVQQRFFFTQLWDSKVFDLQQKSVLLQLTVVPGTVLHHEDYHMVNETDVDEVAMPSYHHETDAGYTRSGRRLAPTELTTHACALIFIV